MHQKCHKDVVDNQAPHQKTAAPKPDCVSCHEGLWDKAKKEGREKSRPDLGLVVAQAERYKQSVHSKPNADHPTRSNATCINCHDTRTRSSGCPPAAPIAQPGA